MKKWILLILTVGLIVAHQDYWSSDTAFPLLSNFLPIGLWYHLLFCIAAAILLALLVYTAWPTHLENAQPETDEARRAEGQSGH
jgi:hypothetical protein